MTKASDTNPELRCAQQADQERLEYSAGDEIGAADLELSDVTRIDDPDNAGPRVESIARLAARATGTAVSIAYYADPDSEGTWVARIEYTWEGTDDRGSEIGRRAPVNGTARGHGRTPLAAMALALRHYHARTVCSAPVAPPPPPPAP